MAYGESFDPAPASQHQSSKSSMLKNFVHRRQPSRGEALVPEPQSATIERFPPDTERTMAQGTFAKNNPGALGELQKNQQESAPRLYRSSRDEHREHTRGRSLSPTKVSNPFRSASKDASKAKDREVSPSKPHKKKSGTNLVGLLSRPKSLKNMYKLSSDEEKRLFKDKENRTPDESPILAPPPPIYAQFASDASVRQHREQQSAEINKRDTNSQEIHGSPRPAVKQRPKSFQVPPNTKPPSNSSWGTRPGSGNETGADPRPQSGASKSQRSKVFGMLTGKGHARSKSVTSSPTTVAEAVDPVLDPGKIDELLEAMLDRRNIPENQRYKMRNLNDTIKMEFIRQDWAETRAVQGDRTGSTDSLGNKGDSNAIAAGSDSEAEKPKRTRGKSFTFSRGRKEPSSPSKKQRAEGTLGRHFRSKSSESVVSERPTSSGSVPGSNIFSKIKLQQGPVDYVTYLRKVQQPELVEVGKLHKLRLLLRNETVAWIEDFIQKGGMKEIIGLLNRIMDVEWREEHEDALLHENLLCLKALSTTASGIQYIHTVQGELFPKLIQMLFDPERKGPSEYTTRNIVTSVLFTYIESATPAERVLRAKGILGHLRDPLPKEEERPLPFVLEMRQERPYRAWNKEVVSVTKEVFWIFLHNLNVVSLPSTKDAPEEPGSAPVTPRTPAEPYAYMLRNFPQERPPVPAAPYVGGVEWDATNYLASHLDLMNAILACTPTAQARNTLRAQLRISSWERCMGGTMRLCKEKFYGSVHDGLRTWVAAAVEDGWDVRDVRFGPPPESKSPPKRAGGGQKVKVEDAPKLDIPKLDLGLPPASNPSKIDDAWL